MKVKLLIADDSTLVRNNIKRLLKEVDPIDIIESSNAADSIKKLKESAPDVLLLDLRMPEGSGYDVLKYLQNEKKKPVIIVLTNSSDTLSRDRCFKLGCDYFFDKSKEHREAVRIINQMAAEKKGEKVINNN
jgi:DNA-binding NarL/FixJ family response regulator